MPSAAVAMLDTMGTQEIEKRHNEVLTAYSLDFARHAPLWKYPELPPFGIPSPRNWLRRTANFYIG
jgi:hypothetical protein